MDTLNLQSASEYLNNLLLARGLLRNGKRIDFADPGNAADGAEDTMAQIINLIHDLVTRRDVSATILPIPTGYGTATVALTFPIRQREAEQRESLATTVKNLRKTEAKQALQVEQLEGKTKELSRSIALAEGQETAFKTTIRNADITIRGLKDQMQRMKSSIQQIRTQCATDIRKRDIELQKLKTHLTERQRGKRDGYGVMTITIQPPPKTNTSSRKGAQGGTTTDIPGYSLKQETTEYLTQLCQSLSDENDALIQLSRDTIQTLRELQGLEDGDVEGLAEGAAGKEEGVDAALSRHELLSREMDATLDQLRALLTNPSFVPLEEVELRDSEIARLRDGWEKMEQRWQEAVSMMDGWHKRVSHGSGSISLDELRLGMSFTTDSSMQKDAGSTLNLSVDQSESGNSAGSSRRVSNDSSTRERPKRLFDIEPSGPAKEHAPPAGKTAGGEKAAAQRSDATDVRQKRRKLQRNRPA
ncbi:NIMA interactive protein [Trichophyton interdigitale]|nr:NIMA interactive protein [Trichophyton interdigitale]KAG5216877.1 NIMA interactive protein [Trichophyton interdigitale]KAG8205401.1 NIMA interactive protein [Trichophyton interdigitale]